MFSEHVIFVLCAGSYSHEIGLVNFVRPLRTSSLLTHRMRDIVFYMDPAFVEAEWKTIANFPRLFVYPVRLRARPLCRFTVCFLRRQLAILQEWCEMSARPSAEISINSV